MSDSISRRNILSRAAIVGVGIGAIRVRRSAAAPAFAMNGDMPMTGIEDGKLIGTTAE